MCVLQNVNQIKTRLCKLYTLLLRLVFSILVFFSFINSDFQLIFYVLDQSKSFYRYGFWEWHLMAVADSWFDTFPVEICYL